MSAVVFGTAAIVGDCTRESIAADGSQPLKEHGVQFGLDGTATVDSTTGVSKYRTNGYVIYTLSRNEIDISTLVLRGQHINGPNIGELEIVCGPLSKLDHIKGTIAANTLKAKGKGQFTCSAKKRKAELLYEFTGDIAVDGTITSLKVSAEVKGDLTGEGDLGLHFVANQC